MTRANRPHYLPLPKYNLLNLACESVVQAFGDHGWAYLVGSCMERPDWHDVDVRYILEDAEFDHVFGTPDEKGARKRDMLWTLMCTSISIQLSQISGLPVDFQIQRQSDANAKHKGVRNALGIRDTHRKASDGG